MEQMQGLDAAFVALEQPSTPLHIGSIAIYDPSTAPGGFVRFKDILSFIQSRLQLSSTMRQKMVKVPFGVDYPYWVQDINFDLEYHVRHLALPAPGDWRQLNIQAARLFARPLDLTRPPWEMTVVEGLDNVEGVPKGSYAIISKVHHAAIDGVSGVDMMQALHTLAPHTEPLEAMDTWKPESNPSQTELFVRGSVRSMTQPFRQMNAGRKLLPGVYRAAKGYLNKEFDAKAMFKTPRTRFNGKVSPHRVFGSQTFKMAEVNELRALSRDCKLNDVMLSITGGAMRHYLEAHDELPEESLTTLAPISVREKNEHNTMGNQVAGMFVPVGTHLASARDRVKYCHTEAARAKAFTSAMGARQMADLTKLSSPLAMNVGAALASRFKLSERIKPLLNTVVTNVPGPRVPLYSSGAKLVGVYGLMCLVDGMRLGHIVQSYNGDVTLSFTACRDAMPDPDFYGECLRKSFDDHIEALAAIIDAPKTNKPKIKKPRVKKPVKAENNEEANVVELNPAKSEAPERLEIDLKNKAKA